MKLRTRFTLWFFLAAIIPIAAAALVTRTIVSSALRDEADRSRVHSEEKLLQVLGMVEGEVADRIEGLADRDDPYAGGSVLDLQTHGGVLPTWSKKRLQDTGGPLMRQLSLDVLYLLDTEDRVIDAPHYRPAIGEFQSDLAGQAARSKGRPYYSMSPIFDKQVIQRVLVLQAAQSIHEGEFRVSVIGGRRIRASLFEPLGTNENVHIRVVALDGATIIPSTTPWSENGDIFSYALNGVEGTPIAHVQMRVSNDALPALLQKVTLYSASLALVALAITVLLGSFVARRITGDLDALVVGAQAVARGELDQNVTILSGDEIAKVGQAFNTMMADLKDSKEQLQMAERVAAWQEIARRLAHEIKNPLTPIQMSMESLRKTYAKKHPSFDEVFEESTATVLEEAARLRRILTEFADFARMPKPLKAPLSVNEIVSSQVALYQGSLNISVNLLPGLPTISADRDTISQLLLNLIGNAQDAIANVSDGRIQISTQVVREGKAIVIHVDDNGVGISKEIRDKLFTPYFTTKLPDGGTGLGLAICHRIALDHQGQIIASDSPIGGARFSVELPL